MYLHNIYDWTDSLLLLYRDVLLGAYGDFYFRLEEVRILYNFCPFCDEIKPESFLEEFISNTNTSGFCLAHLFTFKEFDKGVTGFAWNGNLTNGFCHACAHGNTGFTSFLSHSVSMLNKSASRRIHRTRICSVLLLLHGATRSIKEFLSKLNIVSSIIFSCIQLHQ